MAGWEPSRLSQFVFNLSAIWVLLWLGLIVLTIALLVLMRTRWGHSRPLHKCAALSLLAHVLLACFATTVKIVSDTAGVPEAPAVWVTIANAPEAPIDRAKATATPRVDAWDSPMSQAAEPQLATPQRQDTQPSEVPLARSRPTDLDEIASNTDLRRAESRKIPEADDTALGEEEIGRDSPEREAEPIETVAAQRRESEPPTLPAETPERPGVASAKPKTVAQNVSLAKLSRKKQPPQPAPQLAEAPRTSAPENTLPDEEDLLSRSESPLSAADPIPDTGLPSEESVASNNEAPAATDAGVAAASPQNVTARDAAAPNDDPTSAIVGSATHEETHRLPTIYRQRMAPDRERLVRRRGGGRETEAAVESALVWLAANQEPDGRWDADQHGAGRERKVLGHDRQGAGVQADTAMTGLALLAFLGAGHTHEQGKFESTVGRGLEYLLSRQAADGNLSGDAALFARNYCHGIATFALGEAYAMTGDERLGGAVRAAAAHTVTIQNPHTGGWRYRPGDQGDTSQLGWQVMAIKSADLSGVQIPGSVRTGAIRFLGSVSAGQQGGLASYRARGRATRAMTAEAIFCRHLLDFATDEANAEAASFLLGEMPGESRTNFYYWYYATLALYQMQGDAWTRWNEALKRTLLPSQRTRGDLVGSWDPDSVWGGYGGRVYSTSMACLCLEVYYRYLPLYVQTARSERLSK